MTGFLSVKNRRTMDGRTTRISVYGKRAYPGHIFSGGGKKVRILLKRATELFAVNIIASVANQRASLLCVRIVQEPI